MSTERSGARSVLATLAGSASTRRPTSTSKGDRHDAAVFKGVDQFDFRPPPPPCRVAVNDHGVALCREATTPSTIPATDAKPGGVPRVQEQPQPFQPQTTWSTHGLAKKHGISHTTVREIWRAFGLKPWREESFKVSPDPDLVGKISDLVGLYINPPVATAVFAVDEKPQIQALNRTAPTLPTTGPGHP